MMPFTHITGFGSSEPIAVYFGTGEGTPEGGTAGGGKRPSNKPSKKGGKKAGGARPAKKQGTKRT